MLPRKTQKILYDAVCSLRLLVEFFAVFEALLAHLPARGQQLAITENCGKRIVQLMRDARNQLAHGSHFFAVQQLLLRAAKIVIGLAGLVIQ